MAERCHRRRVAHADRALPRRARRACAPTIWPASSFAPSSSATRSPSTRSTTSSSAAPTRPARTTATSRAWALLLAGLPQSVPGVTVNRLCGSGLEAILTCARAIRAGEGELFIAGGVESMTRAPFVMPKSALAVAERQRHRVRHVARLALPEREDEEAVPARGDGRDRREPRREVRDRARRAGSVRARVAPKGGRGAGGRALRRRAHRRRRAGRRKKGETRRASTATKGRAPTRRSRSWRGSSRRSAPAARSPPATPRR